VTGETGDGIEVDGLELSIDKPTEIGYEVENRTEIGIGIGIAIGSVSSRGSGTRIVIRNGMWNRRWMWMKIGMLLLRRVEIQFSLPEPVSYSSPILSL